MTPAGLCARWAVERERPRRTQPTRELARREIEFAELYEQPRRDRCASRQPRRRRRSCSSSTRLLAEHPDVRERLGERFPHCVVDELEDAGVAAARAARRCSRRTAASSRPAIDAARLTAPLRGARRRDRRGVRGRYAALEEVELDERARYGSRRASSASAARRRRRARSGARARCRAERRRSRAAERPLLALRERARRGAGGGARDRAAARLRRAARRRTSASSSARSSATAGCVAAALEERSVPFRLAGSAAFFQRPEVRDAIAWLRAARRPDRRRGGRAGADPAAGRAALGRPRPLHDDRPAPQARHGLGARGGAREPAAPARGARPDPRASCKLYRAAAAAIEELRADVFVRRLIERIGFRRQRLFAAHPEAAERLRQPLAARRAGRRLDAARAARLDPGLRPLPGRRRRGRRARAERGARPSRPPRRCACCSPSRSSSRGSSSTASTCSACAAAALRRSPSRRPLDPRRAGRASRCPSAAASSPTPARPARLHRDEPGARAGSCSPGRSRREGDGAALGRSTRRRARCSAPTRSPGGGAVRPRRGPARDLPDDPGRGAGGVLARRRARSARCASTPPIDVNRAVARFLELLKLAALIQRPGRRAERRGARGAQRAARPGRDAGAARGAGALGARRVPARGGARARRAPRASWSPRATSPRWRRSCPRRGEGLGAVGLRHRPLPDLPAQVQVRARLRDPAGADDQPALRDPHPPGARALPRRGVGASAGEATPRRAGLDRLLALFEAAWRRAGFGFSDDELQYRDRAVAALRPLPRAPRRRGASPVWLERELRLPDRPAPPARPRRPRRPAPDGGYELIDYKTGAAEAEARARPTTSSSRSTGSPRARPGASTPPPAATGTCSTTRRSPSGGSPDDLERVERTVLEVGEGILGQDFEPRPELEICSWCDFRLICPASRGVGPASRSAGTPSARRCWRRKRWKSGRSRRPRGRPPGRARRPRSCSLLEPLDQLLDLRVGRDRLVTCFSKRLRPPPRARRPRPRSPIRPSSRRSSASAAFGLGTAAT